VSSNVDAAAGLAISHASLDALVRDDGRSPDAYFDTLEAEATLEGTQTTVRWHRVCHDATLDAPDTTKLIDKAFKLLIDFACSREELAGALATVSGSGATSGQAFAALQEKARRLFTSSTTTGEIGEVILYYLAEHLLRYPQLLCKFPFKTNPNVHAHGADGVHASVDPQSGHLRLHWGEAKLYGDLSKAMDDCFSSLSELVLEPPEAKKTKRRDIELLRDYIALNDPILEQAVREYLDPDDARSNKVKFCGIALVGFDLADYAALTAEVAQKDATAIALRTARWKERFKSAIEKHELVSITIDAFCIPFECVQSVRDAFLKRLGVINAD
jgi:hypothetical protein